MVPEDPVKEYTIAFPVNRQLTQLGLVFLPGPPSEKVCLLRNWTSALLRSLMKTELGRPILLQN